MRAAHLDARWQPRANPAYGRGFGYLSGTGGASTNAPVADRPAGYSAAETRRITWTTAPAAGATCGLFVQNIPWPQGMPGAVSILARSSRTTRVMVTPERTTGRPADTGTDLPAGVWTPVGRIFAALLTTVTTTTVTCYIASSVGGAPVEVGDTLDLCGCLIIPDLTPAAPTPGPIVWPRPL
ncbi:hypothetical protein [Brooklawnia cerclae]|uniref:Uncharacterized protein n=1 Tax=Brooklawnia cerclae TaxID=349934 RepID=A0ABX0SN38_9ACTN|nr:hypothetical protein [Brooklawnia cerclae]NIH58455.1 hypothetical protein [Brooklawnia cerclae]